MSKSDVFNTRIVVVYKRLRGLEARKEISLCIIWKRCSQLIP